MKEPNSHLVQVVNILQDGKYHDGTNIGKKLNITRSAVWKIIKKLTQYNIAISSIKHKGYALEEPLVLLNEDYITDALKTKDLQIEVFESLPSTHTYLRSFMPSSSVRFCIAEEQTEGKGRFNRKWYAPFGQNIYLSYIYSFQKDISEISGLSLVVGLAVISTLKEAIGDQFEVGLKWPNDLVYQDKKLGGILIEVQGESNGTCQALIGIGININMLHNEKILIDREWISLREIVGSYIDRNAFCVNLIRYFLKYLELFVKGGMALFQEEWKQVDALNNRNIEINIGNDIRIKGIARGINALGHLILEKENDEIQYIAAGEASIC